METINFDDVSRLVARQRSRRATMASLVAGLAVLTRSPSTLRARKKKAKKVTLCLNGQTITVGKKQRNGYIRQGATAGKCVAGVPTRCASDSDCNANARETCQSGVCACPAGLVRDANGVCGEPFTCKEIGSVVAAIADCCSGNATPIPTTPPTYQCAMNHDGCLSSADCPIDRVCVNGLCTASPE